MVRLSFYAFVPQGAMVVVVLGETFQKLAVWPIKRVRLLHPAYVRTLARPDQAV